MTKNRCGWCCLAPLPLAGGVGGWAGLGMALPIAPAKSLLICVAPTPGYSPAIRRGTIDMRNLKIAVLVSVGILTSSSVDAGVTSVAYGFCSQPTPPSAFLSKPSKPYCFSVRNCSSWQINSYRNEIDRYFRNLRNYAAEVDSYYRTATEYVECMSHLD